jgi:hypothetical protein
VEVRKGSGIIHSLIAYSVLTAIINQKGDDDMNQDKNGIDMVAGTPRNAFAAGIAISIACIFLDNGDWFLSHKYLKIAGSAIVLTFGMWVVGAFGFVVFNTICGSLLKIKSETGPRWKYAISWIVFLAVMIAVAALFFRFTR